MEKKFQYKFSENKEILIDNKGIQTKSVPFNNGLYYSAKELASIYNVPKSLCKVNIAIIAIKGGFDINDAINNWTFKCNIPVNEQAKVKLTLLNDETGNLGDDTALDIINATCVQMIGGICSNSKTLINLYITNGTTDSICDAIKKAIKEDNSVILYPYGNIFYIGSVYFNTSPQPIDEKQYIKYDREKINKLFKKCAKKGITVCVPSGDLGAPGFIFDNNNNVQFPASSPYVLTCGGSVLINNSQFYDENTNETNWTYQFNQDFEGNIGSGGGFSEIYEQPKYKKNIVDKDDKGRSLPDVTSCGSISKDGLSSGIIITVQGLTGYIGSTFVSSAFYAGFIGAINFKDFIVPYLYKIYECKKKRKKAFHDIKKGYNGAFECEKGFDLCTGLGSINGTKLKKYLDELKESKFNYHI